jgi:hypothetical protein
MINTTKNNRILIGMALVLAAAVPAFGGTIHATGSDSSLYTVDLATGVLARVGSAGSNTTQMLDIAQNGGNLFGVTFASTLFSINAENGEGTRIGSLGAFVNALEFGSDGSLYGAGGNKFFTIDTVTGAATQVGSAGLYNSAGDLAFLNGALYLSSSTRTLATDQLYRINPATGASTALPNAIGFPLVFGLAAENGVLYGISNSATAGQAKIISINASTGVGTFVSNLGSSTLNARTGAGSVADSFDSTYGFHLYGATTVPATAPVPEPATLAPMGLGLAAMAGLSLRPRPDQPGSARTAAPGPR